MPGGVVRLMVAYRNEIIVVTSLEEMWFGAPSDGDDWAWVRIG